MEKIKVQTSQNVAIEYSLANVGERLISNIIDYLIIGGYYAIIFINAGLFDLETRSVFFVTIGLPPMFYQLVCEIFLNGQSIGMRIRKIRVIRLDGKELSVGNCLLRWILRPIDILICGGGVAVISITMTKNGQRLGDIAAGTTVVKEKSTVTLNDTIFESADTNYTTVYSQVSRLSDADISIIKETISIAEKTGNRKAAFATSQKLENLLGIHNLTPADPVKFLKIIVKDYNHITAIK